jgi:hypothetical protein
MTPSMFNGIKVWRLCRLVQKLDLLFFKSDLGSPIWGCIGWNGVGVLSEVEGQMDAEQYVAILEQGLLQIMENSGIPEGDIIFQPYNDPKHTSRRAQI